MSETLKLNQIELLARAIFAHLSPLTGTRATGTVAVTALAGGGDVVLPRNTYLRAIIDDKARDDLIFKVGPSAEDGEGWTIPEDDTLGGIDVVSNVGGADQNLPATARFRFDPPVPGLEQDVELEAAITDGTSLCDALFGSFEGTARLLQRMVFWQRLDTNQSARSFFQAGSGPFPALLMCWTRSVSFQGRTTGGDQGVSRGTRGSRIFREGFEIFVGTGNLGGAAQRRDEGLTPLQAVTELLTDAHRNIDGELLCTTGGIEITARDLAVIEREHFVYRLSFEANSTFDRVLRRTFGPWTKTRLQVPPVDPELDTDRVDVIDPKP